MAAGGFHDTGFMNDISELATVISKQFEDPKNTLIILKF